MIATRPVKRKIIGENAKIRGLVASIPAYWDTINDAIQAICLLVKLGGYCSPLRRFSNNPDNGYINLPIEGAEHVVHISWYKMQSGRWEITAYVSL
jgi:hypothetical protein